MEDHVYPRPTDRSGYRYMFTTKHRGAGSSREARWAHDLSEDDEFSIFNTADVAQIFDEDGRHYGVLRDVSKRLREIGTERQQMAEFPVADEGIPWHGYPAWPLSGRAAENKATHQARPSRLVFGKLESAGVLTKRERKRLFKGDHV
jgi:hypothetical protein